MKVNIEISEVDLRKLILKHLSDQLGSPIEESDIIIEVKSSQNYRSEWEKASFRARVDKFIA